MKKLFQKSGKKINKAEMGELVKKRAEPRKEDTGTVLRQSNKSTPNTREKEHSEPVALEIAEKKDWEVKSLPVWEPGDVILDTYEVEDVISGGMGHVYIANHNKWNVKLAIKSPNEMMLSQKDYFARILREANSWTEMGLHPNIAYCYYVRNIEDVPHIVVEYVDGGDLRQWIEDGKCINYRVNLDLAIQFCHGMEYAHSKGMIHRDIKPANVLITRDGILKITDFGLVREQGTGVGGQVSAVRDQEEGRKPVDHGLTTVGTFMGTEGYIAPEQAESAHDVDKRADIFSFGVCLYEMFCGNKPYGITYGKKQDAPDPVGLSGDEKFPSDIGAVLAKSVQWNPSERYKSFKEIRLEFTHIYHLLFGEESPYSELELLDLEADGLNNQGVSYFDLGRKEDAISCWEQALEINQRHLEATYNISLIQWRDGEITDDEVLRRLDNCRHNPTVDKETLAELTAYIHAERFDPDTAKDVLKDLPRRYEAIFSDTNIDQMRCIRTMEGHAGPVNSVSLTPDGRYTVSDSSDKTIRVWDLETGRCIFTLGGDADYVNSFYLIPNDRYIVSENMNKTLSLCELKTGKCVRTMKGHVDSINSVTTTPDGKYVLTASDDNTLKLWELATGRCIRTMGGHTKGVSSASITTNGRYAVSGGNDKTLRVWDLETGKCVRTMKGDTKSIKSVTITPDSKFAVSRSISKTIGGVFAGVWDLETGQFMHTLKGHTGWVSSVTITRDGRNAVSASHDRTLRVWDLETGKCIRTIGVHTTGWITSATVTPDGRYAVSGSDDKSLRVWDLKTGQCRRTMREHTGWISSVSITEDCRYTVSGSHDKTLRVWKIPFDKNYQAELIVSLPKGYKERQKEESALIQEIKHAETLYKEGNYENSFLVLYNTWKDTEFSVKKAIEKLYTSLMKKGRIKGLAFSFQKKLLKGHNHSVTSVAITPDGRFAVSGSHDKTLRVWDLETGQCIRTMKGHTGGVTSVAITPDGRYAISGSRDKTLRLWDLETGKCIRTMEGHTRPVASVSITPDGRHAVSGNSWGNTLRVWELGTGRCIRTLEGHTKPVYSVIITSDGRFAVSGSWDKTLKVWELETGHCIRTMEGHTEYVQSVTITPDGRFAVSGSMDKTLRVWDFETGKCLRTMKGHTGYVDAVIITPDGRYAISGSRDKTLRLWDLETGKCIHTMKGHTGSINSVTITPDSKYLISGSLDRTLRVWELIWDLEFD